MKRISRVILSIIFCIPMLVGTLFSTILTTLNEVTTQGVSVATPETSIGGGGGITLQ